MKNRAEYIAWCKARALKILISGDTSGAVATMISDLQKWEGGTIYNSDELSMRFAEAAFFTTEPQDVREWINRFQ